MHWLDRVAGITTGIPLIYEPLFARGWGDSIELERLIGYSSQAAAIKPIDIRWSGEAVRDGTFESPLAEFLPPASRVARLRMVGPASPIGACLLMAAFNDHGYTTRIKLAKLLGELGIASVVLENPYYGRRRPHDGQPMRTVVDFMTMGSAAVEEGRSVLASLRSTMDGLPLGVAGYSMGGNVATMISATVPFPVATAGLAASHSPGPIFAAGILARAVDWDALGGIDSRSQLATVLGSASTLNFPAPSHARQAILANPARDGYIPRQAFEDLHAHWPGSELRWLKGGHASLLMFHRKELARTIVDSFQRSPA